VIESGDDFIRIAMTLDIECQLDIRDMITGLMEPGHRISDSDVTRLLTTPRGVLSYHRLKNIYLSRCFAA